MSDSDKKKKESVNKIYDTIMELDGFETILKNLKGNEKEEIMEFMLGLTTTMQEQVDNFAENLTKEKAEKIISELAGRKVDATFNE